MCQQYSMSHSVSRGATLWELPVANKAPEFNRTTRTASEAAAFFVSRVYQTICEAGIALTCRSNEDTKEKVIRKRLELR